NAHSKTPYIGCPRRREARAGSSAIDSRPASPEDERRAPMEDRIVMSDWTFTLVPAPPAGGRIQGTVAWDDPVLAGWEWPFVAVNGARPGPAVLVTAGIHGSEYASIDAAIRLGASLDPQKVRGQVLCLPVMNPSAYWERAPYVSPVDNLNLNRVFPGKAQGTFSAPVAYHLTEPAIRHADAYIDMHGGDLPEALVPFAIYHLTGN